ncbi:hypothetical protein GCM10010532_091750 [Dactylosporangium siamense]|uniref:Uncharacterized protein n=1 Tax=Dactylosporangium siamense TaxID=685454 RepID=A0A919Q014_9ACTN|nr:hypothetical protein Dsi01nite_104420 [Dactylosporangium siamense]
MRLYLAVFAFGAIIAVSMCGDINELFARWSLSWYDVLSDDNHVEATLAVRPLRGINAGIVEELVKGAGVAIACLLARRHGPVEALRQQFADWPIEGLKQVLAIKDGQIIPIWNFWGEQ